MYVNMILNALCLLKKKKIITHINHPIYFPPFLNVFANYVSIMLLYHTYFRIGLRTLLCCCLPFKNQEFKEYSFKKACLLRNSVRKNFNMNCTYFSLSFFSQCLRHLRACSFFLGRSLEYFKSFIESQSAHWAGVIRLYFFSPFITSSVMHIIINLSFVSKQSARKFVYSPAEHSH